MNKDQLNILYIFGNGFDLSAGLNTSSHAFLEEYKNHLINDDLLNNKNYKKLFDSLNKNGESWSNLEQELGKFTKKFCWTKNAILNFNKIKDDLTEQLYYFISKAEETIDWKIAGWTTAEKFYSCLHNLFCNNWFGRDFDKLPKDIQNHNWNVNIITFNYTHLIDKLVNEINSNKIIETKFNFGGKTYDRVINDPLHIHGQLNSFGIVMGVDNIKQISNLKFRLSKVIQNSIVKPIINFHDRFKRDEYAERLINESDLIFIYGSSLGKTDKTWWNKIANWLVNSDNHYLIIHIHKNNPEEFLIASEKYYLEQQKVIKKFLNLSNLTKTQKTIAKSNIHISFKTIASEIFT